jgi:DNA modification methylase
MRPRDVILEGDAVATLHELESGSVDCVVTSPPYYRLRDYGVAGQLGLEPTVDDWVKALAAVMNEIKRLLRPHGTVWLNLGDSYERTGKSGARPKSLLLGPQRLALALQADGWIIRNQVIWHKANPIPASVQDRLNATYEVVLLLVRERRYYFNLDAIRRPHRSRRRPTTPKTLTGRPPPWAGPLAGWQHGLDRMHAQGRSGHPAGKNPGDVWRLPTSRGGHGHHAAFPERLVERLLLSGCPRWVCTSCQRPWAPGPSYQPACRCEAAPEPGLVLDPFIGSGTTAVVAKRLDRDFVGIELNPQSAALARQRLTATTSSNSSSKGGELWKQQHNQA